MIRYCGIIEQVQGWAIHRKKLQVQLNCERKETEEVLKEEKWDSKQGNMRESIKISGIVAIANPQAFLTDRLKVGIIALALAEQSVNVFKLYNTPVSGKPVIIGMVTYLV